MRPTRDGSPKAVAKSRQGAPQKLSHDEELEQLKQALLLTQKELLEKSDALKRQSLERYQELEMIVHGLRNPASSILSAAEYLIEDAANALTAEQIVLLRGSAECSLTILRMIDNVLDLSKLERGMLTMSRTRTDLVNLVKEIVHLNREQAERKAVSLTMHSDRSALAIDVDPGKITQLIDNLVCNALKSSRPGGKIEIQICATETLASVSIRDEGQDISPECIETLVGPLSGDVIRPEMADAGLGFAVSKRIVALHDGTMNAQKEEGGGRLFTINLPRVNANRGPQPAPERDT